ncbi:MAG: CoA-binding protein [Luteimonas sp.]
MRGIMIQDQRAFDRLLQPLRRIAVLGIKPADHASKPAWIVPAYLHRVGYEIVPVPVYYPDVQTILDKPVFRRVADVPGRIDMVNVFRKSSDLMAHLDDLLRARPRSVWMQTGIRNDEFAERLLAAGIDVVQDECLMVEDRRWRSTR